ncbi:MAG: hypothetical protein JW981_06745 [Anaerolineae bacterium]|nr:hypothetical protein [Anaerolineae bacterium]
MEKSPLNIETPKCASPLFSRSTLATFAIVLAGVFCIYRRLFAGRVLAGGDLHTYFFPYWVAVIRSIKAGELPLWNPYLFAGAPLLANSQVGFFYPLNWPLWIFSDGSLLSATQTLHLSVLLHLSLAGVNIVLLARRLGIESVWGAAIAGVLYMGGGYLGVHIEHLNQLQALAWLPLVLWPPVDIQIPYVRQAVSVPSITSIISLGLILLSGHTQMAFIAAVAVTIWYISLSLLAKVFRVSPDTVPFGHLVIRWFVTLVPFLLAGLIAAVQLFPTFELSGFSMRSGGMSWREAVSFSISPLRLAHVLLPPYLASPLLPEGVGYLGVLGLLLAFWGVWRGWQIRSVHALGLGLLATMGLFFAFGGYNPLYLLVVRLGIPGFVHFRAPARFLAFYVLPMSILAGWSVSRLTLGDNGLKRLLAPLLVVLTVVELVISGGYLPHAQATTPRAYTDLRPATAHLVAATQAAKVTEEPADRFLSISQMLFDPGDKPEIEGIYGSYLSADALWSYLVSIKAREVLAPNLSLAFGVPAVDGYDGGLLPLAHYVAFSKLLFPEGTLDGRLRENLTQIPESRWLSLLGVRFLITDKTGDTWSDDIFYDRQFQPLLSPGDSLSLGWLPDNFKATALGLLYQGEGMADITLDSQQVLRYTLPGTQIPHAPIRLEWSDASTPVDITLKASTALTLTGASLIDERTGTFYPLVLSEDFYLAHSGDVKIYENLNILPRAFLVHQCITAPDDVELLSRMQAADFDPGEQVALLDGELASLAGVDAALCATLRDMSHDTDVEYVEVITYTANHIILSVHAQSPGFVVLNDAWYPGWLYRRTSQAAAGYTPVLSVGQLLRSDLLFRAVYIPAGQWYIVYDYHSPSMLLGAVSSILGCVLCVIYAYVLKSYRCSCPR